MAYQELVNYVRATRARGYGDGDIRRALASEGWLDSDVEEAFGAANLMRNRLIRPNADAGKFSSTEAGRTGQDGGPSPNVKPAPNGQPNDRKPTSQKQPLPGGIVDSNGQSLSAGIPVPDESQAKFSLLSSYFSAIIHPSRTFSRARYHASFLKGVFGYIIPNLLVMAVAFTVVKAAIPSSFLSMGITMLAVYPVLNLVAVIIASLLFNAVLYAISRALGGSATFTQQYFSLSVASVSSFIILVVGVSVSFIPILLNLSAPVAVGAIVLPASTALAAIIALIAIIYSFALSVIALREAHKFSTAKALTVSLIPIFFAVAALLSPSFTSY